MIKLALTLTVVSAFAIGSALAGSCGSCTGGKGKDKGKDKEGTKESHSYTINL
jgi:hypothetical protein